MNLITYTEAARILHVSVDTLQQALEPKRNVFTKAGRRGTNGLLIEEQIHLFTGINPRTGKKKRLSIDALTSEERALWQKYASDFNTSQSIGLQITPDVERLIDEKIKEELARQELARIQEEERIEARNAQRREQQKERLTKDYPFLPRELVPTA